VLEVVAALRFEAAHAEAENGEAEKNHGWGKEWRAWLHPGLLVEMVQGAWGQARTSNTCGQHLIRTLYAMY
jgi:hypothetical protein